MSTIDATRSGTSKLSSTKLDAAAVIAANKRKVSTSMDDLLYSSDDFLAALLIPLAFSTLCIASPGGSVPSSVPAYTRVVVRSCRGTSGREAAVGPGGR
jgi:hypothetical protein